MVETQLRKATNLEFDNVACITENTISGTNLKTDLHMSKISKVANK